jgi:hypothetical protein
MKLIGGIGLVVLGLITFMYGPRNVTSKPGGVITRLFSSAGKPMAGPMVRLQNWIIGLVLIGLGIRLVVGEFQ